MYLSGISLTHLGAPVLTRARWYQRSMQLDAVMVGGMFVRVLNYLWDDLELLIVIEETVVLYRDWELILSTETLICQEPCLRSCIVLQTQRFFFRVGWRASVECRGFTEKARCEGATSFDTKSEILTDQGGDFPK